jgi:hypothetical protein
MILERVFYQKCGTGSPEQGKGCTERSNQPVGFSAPQIGVTSPYPRYSDTIAHARKITSGWVYLVAAKIARFKQGFKYIENLCETVQYK